MQREVKKYLYDIKESIDSIELFLQDKRDFNEYLANKLLRRGIVSKNIPKLKIQIEELLK